VPARMRDTTRRKRLQNNRCCLSQNGNDLTTVEREPVRSAAIRAIGYEPESGTLEVEFHKGPIYRFEGVPEFLYRGFMASRSKGKFFHTRIADRYSFQQVR
jgi:KTSC domain